MSGSRGYRDLATIQSDAANPGDTSPSFTATHMADVPCTITARGGNEAYRGRMLESMVTHIVEMQYVAGVLPTMRLYVTGGIHSGKYLNIQYVTILEGNGRARKLELHCIEQVDLV